MFVHAFGVVVGAGNDDGRVQRREDADFVSTVAKHAVRVGSLSLRTEIFQPPEVPYSVSSSTCARGLVDCCTHFSETICFPFHFPLFR